ncbi:MAG: type I-C CRISPR-associated protein Cas8c/Csd1 [Bacteroidales bacterium]
MILQALYEYYQRKATDPDSQIAPQGLEWKEIPYLIVIDKEGRFQGLEDTSEGIGKERRAKRFLVTKGKGRSGSASWKTANVLWDHFGYVAAQPKIKDIDLKKAKEDSEKQNKTFVDQCKDIYNRFPTNNQIGAVCRFYINPDNLVALKNDQLWKECIKKDGVNLSFRLLGKSGIVAAQSDLYALAQKSNVEDINTPSQQGICLITGERSDLAVLTTATNIPGGKSGAKLVGFQRNSGYDSYYKEQGLNAPISKIAEDAYTTALNELLGKDSLNKYRLNDTSVVFWAQKNTNFENDFSFFFSSPPKDNPDKNIEVIRSLMKGVYSGILQEEDNTPFYILGLAPNAARISVRFWKTGTVKVFAENLKQHFIDLAIIHDLHNEREYFSLFNLLTQVAFQYKMDNLPPNLVADMTQSILDNRPYPATLQIHCITRIRADRSISYIRAAILKSYLNRKYRNNQFFNHKEITMALDLENKNQAYLSGRLFAVLEKIQESALPGINATIKDRYYGAASTTPVTVFNRLISLSNNHLSKIGGGKAVYFEKLIQEIMQGIDSNGFPKHLSLDDQSRFAIGYYHQRQDLFTKKNNDTDSNETK